MEELRQYVLISTSRIRPSLVLGDRTYKFFRRHGPRYSYSSASLTATSHSTTAVIGGARQSNLQPPQSPRIPWSETTPDDSTIEICPWKNRLAMTRRPLHSCRRHSTTWWREQLSDAWQSLYRIQLLVPLVSGQILWYGRPTV